ncbi:hypothetical protein VTK56DRAFT_6446 [Thermocarpiscus australiensis]
MVLIYIKSRSAIEKVTLSTDCYEIGGTRRSAHCDVQLLFRGAMVLCILFNPRGQYSRPLVVAPLKRDSSAFSLAKTIGSSPSLLAGPFRFGRPRLEAPPTIRVAFQPMRVSALPLAMRVLEYSREQSAYRSARTPHVGKALSKTGVQADCKMPRSGSSWRSLARGLGPSNPSRQSCHWATREQSSKGMVEGSTQAKIDSPSRTRVRCV